MITAKVILPGPFSPKAFLDEFVGVAIDTNDEWEKSFKKTHQTWNNQKPVWNKDVSLRFNEVTFSTYTDNLIYFFLNDGTDLRYAVMTPDFVRKTAPGRFKPVTGRGGFSHLDMNYQRATSRGITARRWDTQVKNRTERSLKRRLDRAMEKGATKSGHKHT